jgi:hypothetical protein
MKKPSLIIVSLLIYLNTFGQTEYSSENDVFSSKNIIFYGFDFTGFQLSDPKRMGQDLKKYVLSLTGFLIERLPEKKLQVWLNKDIIIYNLNPTLLLNKKINNEDIASPVKHNIAKDSIQTFIDKYAIIDKEGIGYVIIYECFDNASKRVSAYSVFFDISTRKILVLEHVIVHDHNSFNKLLDWNAPAFSAIKRLTENYKFKEVLSSKTK